MAYNTDYLTCVNYSGGKGGGQLWEYATTDALATVKGSGYVSDATKKGMVVGDSVIVKKVTTLPNTTPLGISLLFVSAISSGAATLKDDAVA